MVSDERRLQLNLEHFSREVHRQWQAYRVPRPEAWQKLWRARSASAADTIKALLPVGAAIMDVGCGTGELAIELARSGYQVSAVDLVEEMLSAGRRSCPEVNWIHAPFTDRVAGRRQLDAVVALGYLEYQERAGKELVRMSRLLKPGGLLILSVPNTLSAQFGFGGARAAFRLGKEPERTRVRHSFTPERLQRLLGMAGYIFMDYQWLSADTPPLALGGDRARDFWKHRIRDRLKPEMLTLSRTYLPTDTAPHPDVIA
jgi:2-polyprenyl-3-methyl-5-hydroxy-6-metoxy-1,4-benzoquinol methylase